MQFFVLILAGIFMVWGIPALLVVLPAFLSQLGPMGFIFGVGLGFALMIKIAGLF